MAEIIKFKKPTPEEKFMQSLSDEQLVLFNEIIELIQEDYLRMAEQITKLENALAKKCVECEMWREKCKK